MNEFFDNQLMETFLNFEGLMHRYFAWKRKEQGPFGNPHRGQGRILRILKLQPEITQKELTFLLDMRPQSLGELLNKMEKTGFISREPSEEDRRVMVVKLTESGKEEADKMNTETTASIFDTLSEEEQELLGKLLEKVSKAMEEELPEDARFAGHHHGGMKRRDFGPHREMKGHHHGFEGQYGMDKNDCFGFRAFDGGEWAHH